MNIQHLKYFESLYRHRKFVAAAKELNISQPALSTQIKALEEYLGFKLFERTTRELKPTESAIVLYDYVSNLLLDYDNLYKEVEEIKMFGSGTIHLGMVESAKKWIPQIIRQYEKFYPNIKFHLVEMNALDINEALLNYDIHLGISTASHDTKNLDYSEILEESLILITSINHRFSQYDTLNFAEIEGENLIQFTSKYRLKTIVADAHRMVGIEPRGKFEVENLEIALSLVEADLGVAILPENYLKYTSLKNIHKIKLINPTPSRKIYLGLNVKRNLSPSITEFIYAIKSFFNRT